MFSWYHGSSPRTHRPTINVCAIHKTPLFDASISLVPHTQLSTHELYRLPMEPDSSDGIFIPAALLPLVKDLLGTIGRSSQLQWYSFILSFWRPGVYLWRHYVYSVRIFDSTGTKLYCTRIYKYCSHWNEGLYLPSVCVSWSCRHQDFGKLLYFEA